MVRSIHGDQYPAVVFAVPRVVSFPRPTLINRPIPLDDISLLYYTAFYLRSGCGCGLLDCCRRVDFHRWCFWIDELLDRVPDFLRFLARLSDNRLVAPYAVA